MSDALALLMVIVSEVRWHTHDAAAIEHILYRYAHNHDVSIAQAAEKLVWPHNRARKRKHTRWLLRLNLTCDEPTSWNEGRWPRAKCQQLVEHIQAFLAWRVADPCRGRATGWRSPESKALRFALSHGFSVVDCGPTLVTFVRPVADALAVNVQSYSALR